MPMTRSWHWGSSALDTSGPFRSSVTEWVATCRNADAMSVSLGSGTRATLSPANQVAACLGGFLVPLSQGRWMWRGDGDATATGMDFSCKSLRPWLTYCVSVDLNGRVR